MAVPVLSAIDLSRPRFKDGDRLIARVSTQLRADQQLKLERSIRRFAHADVRVWIVNCLTMNVDLIRGGIQRENLVSLLHIEPDSKLAGKMNMSLGVVEFLDGDVLEVQTCRMTQQQIKEIQARLKDWSGKMIEVRVLSAPTGTGVTAF